MTVGQEWHNPAAALCQVCGHVKDAHYIAERDIPTTACVLIFCTCPRWENP